MTPAHHLFRIGLLALSFSIHAVQAQHSLLTGYDWDSTPVLPDAAMLDGATDVLVKRNAIGQFVEEDDNVVFFQVFHMQRYLGDEAAVDASKTIHVGTGHIQDILRIKARSIAPDGRITELGKDAIKQSTDDRNRSSGIYFAFEGLEPGSMVEYLMFSRQRADFRGDVARLQFGIPVLEQRYDVLVPRDWSFLFRGYNGTPQPEVDSSHTGVLRHHLTMRNIPALEEERYANTLAYRMYLVHKLDAVQARNIRDISGYTGATRTYHSALYPELGTKTKKELAARLKKTDLAFARDLADRIRSIDRHVRSNFRMAEAGGAALSDLDQVLRTGDCNEFGLQRLYANLFREADIEHQTVITCDVTEVPFDPKFEAHNFLNDVLFYFPSLDLFFDPTEFGLGLGYPAPENIGTHGLFIRNRDIGGVFTGTGTVKPIPALPAEATRHDLAITVRLNDDASEATIELENGLFGYYARYIQNFWPYMDEDQRAELLHNFLDHFTEGARRQDIRVDYAEHRYFGVKPFTMTGQVVTSKFTSQAGDEVLLRVGDLIGPQVEMYVEKERKLPADSEYNRYYDRRITIPLPNGWHCTDLSPMAIHKTMGIDGQMMAEFRSSATEKDGVITVEVIEYYRTNHVPLEHFEAYRSVINAAADFNKRTLLLGR